MTNPLYLSLLVKVSEIRNPDVLYMRILFLVKYSDCQF